MEEDDFKKLPIEERCIHKSWKARVNGYEEITKLFRQIDDEKSPEYAKYLGLVRKFVIDSNVMGQEKGLEATLAYVENYAHAGKTVNEVMAGVVTKCIAAPKARTRELALQLTLMYIEIEKYEAVEEELVKGMEQKNPKIVAACINACTMALHEFGSKIINVKPLVKKITPLFADRDKAVRDEARGMVVEIYRWIGGLLRTQLNNLQPVQVAELETEFAKVENQKPIPKRYIRSQQQKQEILINETEEANGDQGEPEQDAEGPNVDSYDLIDPVDILSKIPKDWYEKIEAKKWQERKQALETLEKLVQTPKLENGDYGDLIRALKKVIQKDSNVICVALAGKCITGLASGLKKRFQIYSGTLVSTLLEKFKEKKQNVVLAIREAIDAVYLTTNIEPIHEDVLEALANKNPSVKTETSLFLSRAFTKTSPAMLNKKLLKSLTTGLTKLLNEPDPTVRDAAAEAIGTIMKLVGEKAIGPFLVELEKDALKMAKIKECCEKAVITVKMTASKKERPTTAPTKTSVTKPASTIKSASASIVSNNKSATIIKKKPDILSGSATVVRSKGKSQPVKSPKTSQEKELNDEEIDEIVSNLLSSNVINDLGSANWKARLEASEKFLIDIQNLESKNIPVQALVKILSRKPGFKDTNFQVIKQKLDIVKYLAENCTFSTTTANCCILELAEKFSDVKNGQLVAETMTAITEATNLNYVSTTIVEFAINQKNPKVIQEIFLWLATAIKEFGFTNMNSKMLIDNSKKALQSTNPGVRQAAITLCGILYLYMGVALNAFFENEKAALRDQINVEFDKYEGEKPPTPIRGGIKNAQSSNSLDNLDDNEQNINEDINNKVNLQDLLPRIDISNQITETLINEIEDKNWKVRNEALTKVSGIIQDAKFIKSNLGDLPSVLVHRLSDSNTKIAQTALNICESIAKAMGPPSKQYIRVFFPSFLQCLGDSKTWMRSTAIDTINVYAEQCGYKEFFENEMIGDALKSGSPTLRIELWNWLADKLPKIPLKSIPKEELIICIPHLYNNLEDRNVDVRKNAQEVILGIMIHLGYETMVKHTEKLKTGSKTVVLTALEKVRPNLPAKPLPAKKVVAEKEEKVVRGTKPVANAKNAVKQKSANSKAAPAVVSRKKDDDVDTSPLLVVNNMKHQRTIDESKLKVLKWNFTTPREEFVDLLKDQMSNANVNKTLMANMFHIDFKYHIKAIESLTDDLPDNIQALIANLDLILKWLTLRFFDTNPSVLLKGLEYLHSVFNMLIESKYHMLENEASSFLPYLVLKIGDPKDSVRNGVRALFKQICFVYPISRLFTYIMDGIKSKNARQRAECLEVMGTIIQDYGITVCTPSPAFCLKEVAKQISDRDNSVRNAALNCFVQAYNIVGERVYKMIGNISDKDLSLLEERIKRSKKAAATKQKNDVTVVQISCKDNSTIINETIQQEQVEQEQEKEDDEEEDLPSPIPLPTQIVKEQSDIRELSEPKSPFRLDKKFLSELDTSVETPSMGKIQEFDLDFLSEEVTMPKLSDVKTRLMPLSPPKPLDPNKALNRLSRNRLNCDLPNHEYMIKIKQIGSSDIHCAIIAVKQIQQILKSTKNNLFIDFENELIENITQQLKYMRNKDPNNEAISKMYRELLTCMDAFYFNKILGRQLSIPIIKGIMNELIILLIDGKLETISEGDAYVRVVNLICVSVIERSNHTKIICALVNLIHECIRNDSCESRQTELVMKCLWRVIKIMPTWDEDIEYDSVLLEVHNFLKEFPSSWWRNKSIDTPLRTVKTVLHSCVKIKGSSLMLHLTKIPNTSESELEAYILKLLKSLKLDQNVPAPEPQKKTLSRFTHTVLTDIFQKIGTKEETKEGLNLLYDFMQQHPEADIEPFLKKSSKFFQDYIKNGLDDIERTRKTSTIATVEKKVSESISSNVDNIEDRGPEFWRQRLDMWKKRLPNNTFD